MLTNILISIMFCAAAALIYVCTENKSGKVEKSPAVFVLCIAVAAAARILPALNDYYFTYDVNTFKAWGSYVVEYGFGQLYSLDIFLDYPPGYMYVLYILQSVCNVFGLQADSIICTFIYKLPAIAADFGIAWLIYKAARENCEKRTAQFAAAAFLLMPAVIFNSSVWGQVESVYLFFVVLSFYFAANNRTVPSAASYAAALAIKPQALMFGAVLLFYIVCRKSIKELAKALVTGLGCFYVIILPFCKSMTDIGWIADLYFNTMRGYRYYTVNAYNIFYTMGLNWKPADNAGTGAVNIAVILCVVAATGVIVLKQKGRDRYFAGGAVAAAAIFSLCTMMHERYLFPAIVLLAMAFACSGKKIYLAFCAVFGGLNFLNSACVMAMYYGTFKVYPAAEKAAGLLTTACGVIFAVWMVKNALKGFKINTVKMIKAEYAAVVITLIYAIVALSGLGSTKAPQSFYQSTEADNSFVITFDSPQDIGRVFAYSGLGDETAQPYGRKVCGEFAVEWSSDGESYNWLCDIEGQSVYTWKEYYAEAQQVSKVKVTAKNPGAVLHEIVFRDTAGNVIQGEITDIAIDDTNRYTALNAFDEQYAAPKDTSYYQSMYFDEIYHARTAYEQLNGMQIYETTHPPLGKIIIGLGIALFGMTPFGWRVAGAVCGIVMLPVIYLLAKQLAGKKAALIALLLTALDFMHLTQTRIATVDTFVVLFCLLTFLFMVNYHKTAFKDKKEYLYLLLSGICMGCAVASKWNGAYPMIALAVIFFISLGTKYLHSSRETQDKRHIVKTLAFCCLAFVIVPLVIYAASYIPVIKAHTVQDYFRQLTGYQKHMFDYHKNLEAEHFFSSMWYTWPLCIKPVWYAVAGTAGGLVSSIAAFGNPLVWMLTPAAAIYCLYRAFRTGRWEYWVPSLGFVSSYIPWIAVTRLCFIYHYFPCAMFGIVCVALALCDLIKVKPECKKLVSAYIVLCLVAFLMFLPVTTGWPAPKGYIEFLELMPQWYFVN